MASETKNKPVEVDHRVQHQLPDAIRFCSFCGGELELRLVIPDHKRHKVCSNCGFVHFLGPKLVAGCLVIDGGRVLLLRRALRRPQGSGSAWGNKC